MLTGYIAFLHQKRRFGFISCPEIEGDLFFHKDHRSAGYKVMREGDKVVFDVSKSDDGSPMGVNIQFVNNLNLDSLRKDFEKGSMLKGYLKKVEERYYVKDLDTYMFIPIVVSKYELNASEFYEMRLNELVEYKLIRFTSKNMIWGLLCHRQFSDRFNGIMSGETMKGELLRRVKGGYSVEFGDGESGFIPGSMAGLNHTDDCSGVRVDMRCTGYHEYYDTFVFEVISAAKSF